MILAVGKTLYALERLLLLSGQLKPTMHFAESAVTAQKDITTTDCDNRTKFSYWRKLHASKHEWCSEHRVLKADIF
jgi:hypothetical protein